MYKRRARSFGETWVTGRLSDSILALASARAFAVSASIGAPKPYNSADDG